MSILLPTHSANRERVRRQRIITRAWKGEPAHPCYMCQGAAVWGEIPMESIGVASAWIYNGYAELHVCEACAAGYRRNRG